MPYGRKKRRKQNIYLHNQGRVPTWPLSPDDARLEQETNEDALDRQMYELNFQVDGSAEKASLQGQIDVLNDRIAADSGLHAYAVRQTPGLVRRQALGDGNCLFATMSLNFFSVTGKNLDSFAPRARVKHGKNCRILPLHNGANWDHLKDLQPATNCIAYMQGFDSKGSWSKTRAQEALRSITAGKKAPKKKNRKE